jgi:threonine synthase
MKNFIGYQCSICKEIYDIDQVKYVCPVDSGNLDVVLDYATLRRNYWPEDIVSSTESSLWRYLPLLPVDEPGGNGTSFRAAGWTPIYSPPDPEVRQGLKHFWIKDESRNPTASFKDRASAVVIAHAREIGSQVVVTASTGNAGAALAGMAAAVGQKAVIFAPRTAPPAKVAQLLVYGATVLLVDGNYDQAFDLSIEASNEFGWYCRNTGYNPFTLEGKKTAAFEIWESMYRNVISFVPETKVLIYLCLRGRREYHLRTPQRDLRTWRLWDGSRNASYLRRPSRRFCCHCQRFSRRQRANLTRYCTHAGR